LKACILWKQGTKRIVVAAISIELVGPDRQSALLSDEEDDYEFRRDDDNDDEGDNWKKFRRSEASKERSLKRTEQARLLETGGQPKQAPHNVLRSAAMLQTHTQREERSAATLQTQKPSNTQRETIDVDESEERAAPERRWSPYGKQIDHMLIRKDIPGFKQWRDVNLRNMKKRPLQEFKLESLVAEGKLKADMDAIGRGFAEEHFRACDYKRVTYSYVMCKERNVSPDGQLYTHQGSEERTAATGLTQEGRFLIAIAHEALKKCAVRIHEDFGAFVIIRNSFEDHGGAQEEPDETYKSDCPFIVRMLLWGSKTRLLFRSNPTVGDTLKLEMRPGSIAVYSKSTLVASDGGQARTEAIIRFVRIGETCVLGPNHSCEYPNGAKLVRMNNNKYSQKRRPIRGPLKDKNYDSDYSLGDLIRLHQEFLDDEDKRITAQDTPLTRSLRESSRTKKGETHGM
jgi:hypothetical protein